MAGLETIIERAPILTEEDTLERSGKPSHVKLRNKVLQEFDASNESSESKEFYQFFEKAQSFYLEKNDDDALQSYVQAATIARYDGPEVFECYKNIGNILLRIGDLSNAESFYLKAYTINPDSDSLLVNFGTLEMQKGEFQKALERYRAAVQIEDKNERAWVGLAIIHREYGDHDLAWANIEKALDINSNYLIAIDLAFEWGIKDSRFDSLIDRVEDYLEAEPDNVDVKVKLAKTLVCGQRFNSALKEIHSILKADGENQEALQLQEVLTQSFKRQDGNESV